jgi:hypothetical protein
MLRIAKGSWDGCGRKRGLKAVVLALLPLGMAACALPGYRYTGGMSIGAPSLVDSRADMAAADETQGDHPPRVVRQGNLVYPTWAMLQAACGTVTVATYIDADGRPHDARVVKQHFNTQFVNDENTYKQYPVAPFFDRPAIDFVMSSKFEPGRVKGVPTGMSLAIPITFGNSSDGKCRPR